MKIRYAVRGLMLVGDLLVYYLSYQVALYLRFLGAPPQANYDSFLRVLPWLLVSLAFLHLFYRLYELRTSWSELSAGVISAALLNQLVAFALSYWLRGFAFPRSVFAIALFLTIPLTLAWRRVVHILWSHVDRQKVLVVAATLEEAEAIARRIRLSTPTLEVQGLLSTDGVKNPDTVIQTAGEMEADTLLLCDGTPHDLKLQLIGVAYASGYSCLVVPDLPEILLATTRQERVDDLLLLRVDDRGARWDPLKRMFDIVLSLIGLIGAFPAMALIAIAVKLESPGPALYVQERVTVNGRPFRLYKFRTMRQDAESNTGPILSAKGDPRVTRLGRFLRAVRLDELPQLWNVLVGDMSLVGPRPERPYFVNQFLQSLPHYSLRHSVRPGITGLAQVNGRYSTTVQDKLRFDLLYVQTRSVYTDLSILLETVRTVLIRGKSA